MPSPESINEILSLPAPFDISSGCSHLELAKKFARERGSRKGFTVYIFDADLGGKQIIGSPSSTYGAGHEALGLKAGSRIIGRYIDTGKMYNAPPEIHFFLPLFNCSNTLPPLPYASTPRSARGGGIGGKKKIQDHERPRYAY